MIGLCLAMGMATASLPTDSFTLAWTHSVEKVEWREDWRVTPDGLLVAAARVRGSGAGMEPPEGATLSDGWWEYRPAIGPVPRLILPRSRFTSDYAICTAGRCRPLAEIIPAGDEPTVLTPCPTDNQE